MSNNDSFIEEVSEEVVRDRLFLAMRRYGWIAIVGVLTIVGGAAYNEWNKTQTRAAAESAGDNLVAALTLDDSSERLEALSQITVDGDASMIVAFMQAAEANNAGDTDAAVAALDTIANDADVGAAYSDLAVLKRAIIQAGNSDQDGRISALQAIAAPGAPYRLLAEEQLALIDLEKGDAEAAISRFRTILEDTEVTAGLRNRLSQLIVALGGQTNAG